MHKSRRIITSVENNCNLNPGFKVFKHQLLTTDDLVALFISSSFGSASREQASSAGSSAQLQTNCHWMQVRQRSSLRWSTCASCSCLHYLKYSHMKAQAQAVRLYQVRNDEEPHYGIFWLKSVCCYKLFSMATNHLLDNKTGLGFRRNENRSVLVKNAWDIYALNFVCLQTTNREMVYIRNAGRLDLGIVWWTKVVHFSGDLPHKTNRQSIRMETPTGIAGVRDR